MLASLHQSYLNQAQAEYCLGFDLFNATSMDRYIAPGPEEIEQLRASKTDLYRDITDLVPDSVAEFLDSHESRPERQIEPDFDPDDDPLAAPASRPPKLKGLG